MNFLCDSFLFLEGNGLKMFIIAMIAAVLIRILIFLFRKEKVRKCVGDAIKKVYKKIRNPKATLGCIFLGIGLIGMTLICIISSSLYSRIYFLEGELYAGFLWAFCLLITPTGALLLLSSEINCIDKIWNKAGQWINIALCACGLAVSFYIQGSRYLGGSPLVLTYFCVMAVFIGIPWGFLIWAQKSKSDFFSG